jgi:pimeloyl-ACP methyl ester carboxylesterase
LATLSGLLVAFFLAATVIALGFRDGAASGLPRRSVAPGLAADSAPMVVPPPGVESPPSGKLGTYSNTQVTQQAPDFAALPGAQAEFGKLGNAVYQVEIPVNWNHELVLFAHGFAGFGNEVSVGPPPDGMRQALIAGGFAWAASSYSENGYDPGIGADDTLALEQFFDQEHGKPVHAYLLGVSMGGNVAALSLEHFADAYDGALAMCGSVGGEEEIDFLTSWAAVAEFTSGVHLPIGEPTSGQMVSILLGPLSKALGPVDNPTDGGKQFADIIQNLTGGPRPFFGEGFADQYLANFGLLIADSGRKLLAARAATNDGVQYQIDPGFGLTDAQVNAGVRRFAADPSARNAQTYPDAVPTTGKITKPMLTLHGTGDLFVPISQEISYREKVDAAGADNLLVQRAIRSAGHCAFSPQEVSTAFTDLVNWVRNGAKPAGDNLLGDLSDIGRQFTNPIRPNDPGTK